MGEKGSMSPEGEAAIALNMLNVFVQATPRMSALTRLLSTVLFN